MAKSGAVKALAVIAVLIVAAFALCAGLTYPRTVLTIPVSLTVGADVTNTKFDQPILDNMVQVQVSVQSGTALWQAQILYGNQVIWQHAASQGEQTSYNSG